MSKAGSFVSFYEEHVWQVYGFFGYRLGSREDAEDLTQLTFERLLKAWDRYDHHRGSGTAWVMATARNLLVDHYRSGRVRGESAIDLEGALEAELAIEPPQDQSLGIAPELERALDSLGQRDRELVALRFGADLSGPEIAELTGLTPDNVHQILSRSLRRLRAELEVGAPSQN